MSATPTRAPCRARPRPSPCPTSPPNPDWWADALIDLADVTALP